MTVSRRSRVMVCVLSAVLLTGCAASEQPKASTATWQLASPEVSAESQELEIAVTRLGCAGGKTGSVLAPQVKYEADRILIRTDVPALDGVHSCQGNDSVTLAISLDEPVGGRQLVDAACLETEAADTVFCSHNGVRWPPTSG